MRERQRRKKIKSKTVIMVMKHNDRSELALIFHRHAQNEESRVDKVASFNFETCYLITMKLDLRDHGP